MARILYVVLIQFLCDYYMYYLSNDAIVKYHFNRINYPGLNIPQSSDSADSSGAAQTISIGTKKLFVTGMLFHVTFVSGCS